MATTYKTTKGNKVSIDYIKWSYDWKDIREYIWGGSNECKVYMNLGRDYVEINETNLGNDEISYLLGDTEFMDDFNKDEQKERNKHMKEMEKDNLITYFKVRDRGSNGLDLKVVMDPKEANGFIIRKKKENKEYPVNDLKETLNYFRAYIEGSFLEVSIYSPTKFISEKDPRVTYIHYDYEDGESFLLSYEDVFNSIDSKTWGEIIKDSEEEGFSCWEYKGPGDN